MSSPDLAPTVRSEPHETGDNHVPLDDQVEELSISGSCSSSGTPLILCL
jgi:hypothetical protein